MYLKKEALTLNSVKLLNSNSILNWYKFHFQTIEKTLKSSEMRSLKVEKSMIERDLKKKT